MPPIPPGRPAQIRTPGTIGRRRKKLGPELMKSAQVLPESTQYLVESTQLIGLRP
jgi:hypothetical protein